MINGKVGVLTFHRCINYGSYWQARCLVDGLRERGHDAVLLDHHSPRVRFAELKCGYRPTLPTPVPRSDMRHYRAKMTKFLGCIEDLPMSRPFRLERPADAEPCDVVVIGSDEVWNFYHPWYGGQDIFFGKELRTRRLVSYAASFGNYPSNYGLGQPWADLLSRFSDISVRDVNSQVLLKNALNAEPEVVLDPCLQFSIRPEERDLDVASLPYVAVYGHNFSPSFIGSVRSWARTRGLRLISIGYRNNWAHRQFLTADPHDFACLMERAAAVVTNFFHGCVFALRYLRSFVCEAGPYRQNKLQGLMAQVGSTDRLVGEETPTAHIHDRLDNPLDAHILNNLSRLRARSDAFLKSSLAG